MQQSKKITDGAILTSVFILLLLITVFIPVLNILSLILLPIPFILYASRHDWKAGLLMMSAALVLSLFFATIFSLPTTVMMGLGGIMIGSAIYQKVSAYETWARGTFGFIIGLVFAFLFTQFILQVNWIEEFEMLAMESMQMTQGLLEQFGAVEQSEQVQELLQQQVDYLIDLFPVGLAMAAIAMAFISQWMGYKVINRIERKGLYFPPFRQLEFPIALIWIYLVALIVSLFPEPGSILFLAAQNVLMLTGILLMIQGFSFIFFYAHLKKWSKAIPVLLVVFAFLVPPVLLYLVRILGIIDMGFRLRERLSNGK
ncbi:YybS family protein [Lentibacillus sediminis]|uniref:YybS family protein n=1 Tax=Lentibacillus sediminis TaxID=1940529 RepID=UPI000C1C7E82|nr:YybS family protein [Lentibacillus sediminis]